MVRLTIQALLSGLTGVLVFTLGWCWYYVTVGWRWYSRSVNEKQTSFFSRRYRLAALLIFAVIFVAVRKFVHH
ncbi:MAG TPA: hypothetical protein VHR84_03390 [Terriglobales bacterium]|jgi:hypothetical protein|nr:hypothetical protein [Terriglobales bacterium]